MLEVFQIFQMDCKSISKSTDFREHIKKGLEMLSECLAVTSCVCCEWLHHHGDLQHPDHLADKTARSLGLVPKNLGNRN